ncbi:hypothetical protein ABT373_11310 [Streptomyces sp. NPDC000070]|uniref:hypothetical protein n=1 Tax=Streptomyces sp. NPDC000070 TaxID=3154240 RepID=UPI00332FBF2F
MAHRDAPEQGPDDESGRGLLLVDALADRRGTEPRPPSGKAVWAEISGTLVNVVPAAE